MQKGLLFLCLLATGCAWSPTAPQESSRRMETLRLACLNDAERVTSFIVAGERHGGGRDASSSSMRSLKDLCETMSSAMLDDHARLKQLDMQCHARLNALASDPHSTAGKNDLRRMRSVCDAMATHSPDQTSPPSS
jgi:hypothetical protein